MCAVQSKAAPVAKKPKKEKVMARVSFMDDEEEDEDVSPPEQDPFRH